MTNDERNCPKHLGGKHCWHPRMDGQPSFKGKWERHQPVYCCHCKVRGVRLEHAAENISYE